MPTLAQALQGRPPDPQPPRIATVVSANANTITTSYGVIVNAMGHHSPPHAGDFVIVFTIDGAQYAMGWFD